MLVLSWAFSALSAPLSPRNISCAWKGSLMFCFIFVSVFVFFSFCFWDCEWCSWDGGDKSHFIRLQHPSACKTWLVFLLLCLSWAFSGHWRTWPHSSWGIFNLLESTEKSHCRFPVAHQSNQYPSTAFLLLRLLLPGGKIITAHSRLHFGCVQLREARTSSRRTPRRLVSLNSPFWQANYFLLSPLLLLPPKMGYLHTYKVFWGYEDVFTALPSVLNALSINNY